MVGFSCESSLYILSTNCLWDTRFASTSPTPWSPFHSTAQFTFMTSAASSVCSVVCAVGVAPKRSLPTQGHEAAYVLL